MAQRPLFYGAVRHNGWKSGACERIGILRALNPFCRFCREREATERERERKLASLGTNERTNALRPRAEMNSSLTVFTFTRAAMPKTEINRYQMPVAAR